MSSESEEKLQKDPLYSSLKAYKSRAVLKNEGEVLSFFRLFPSFLTQAKDGNQAGRPRHKKSLYFLPPLFWKVAALLIFSFFTGLLLYYAGGSKESDIMAESFDSKKEIILSDQSNVILRPYSRLLAVSSSSGNRHYQIEGEGYFDIAPDPERSFIVDAGEGRVVVYGTRFSVSTWGEKTRVLLETGSVIFSHIDGEQEAALLPGEQSTLTEGRITTPQKVIPEHLLGWLQNELILDSRPLSEIILEISHHFGKTLTIQKELQEVKLSGTLNLDEFDSVLNDLALSLGGSVHKNSTGDYHLILFE